MSVEQDIDNAIDMLRRVKLSHARALGNEIANLRAQLEALDVKPGEWICDGSGWANPPNTREEIACDGCIRCQRIPELLSNNRAMRSEIQGYRRTIGALREALDEGGR